MKNILAILRTIAPNLAIIACVLFVSACAENASGLKFDQVAQNQLGSKQSRVYFFRDNVLYVLPAPYTKVAIVKIDNQRIGGIRNGGFVEATIPSGRHYYSVESMAIAGEASGYFDVTTSKNIYFEVWDKVQMRTLGSISNNYQQDMSNSIHGRGAFAVFGVEEEKALPILKNLYQSDEAPETIEW